MEARKIKKSFMDHVSDVFKKTDRFGLAFSLNHENNFEFHTVTGGLFSLILYFIVGYTIVTLMIRMVYRHEVTTEITNTDNQFMFNNETVTPFENNKFTIGFQVNVFVQNPEKSWMLNQVGIRLHKFSSEYDEQTQVRTEHNEYFNPSKWNESDFPAKALEAYPHVGKMYWLPKDIELKGGVLSNFQTQYRLHLYYIPDSSWATFEEFKEEVARVSIYYLVVDESFNPTNFDDPISTVVNDQYFTSTDPSVYSFYDILIQKNEYEIDKGYILTDLEQGSLYKVTGSTKNTIKQFQNTEYFFSGTFRLSSESNIYKSRVSKFLDVLGIIGGVYELTFGVLSIIFSIFSRKLYFYHMVNSLKRVESWNKRRVYKVSELAENQDSQSVNRLQHNSQNFQINDKYASTLRAVNYARDLCEAKNKLKVEKLNALK